MKKGIRVAAALMAAAMMAASLSGCGNSGQSVDESIEFTEAATEATEATEGATEAAADDKNGETPTDEGYGILREASVNKIGSLNPLTYINSYSSTQIKRCSLLLYTYFPN